MYFRTSSIFPLLDTILNRACASPYYTFLANRTTDSRSFPSLWNLVAIYGIPINVHFPRLQSFNNSKPILWNISQSIIRSIISFYFLYQITFHASPLELILKSIYIIITERNFLKLSFMCIKKFFFYSSFRSKNIRDNLKDIKLARYVRIETISLSRNCISD